MKRSNVAIFVPHIGCPFRCSFCDQNAITGETDAPDAAAVTRACETAAASGCSPESEIAFFGGSFTAIPRDYSLSLLRAAAPYIESGRFRGIRISTRPDFIDQEILGFLSENHVTSIELGAQSMDNGVLLCNRRGHTGEQVKTAAELIRAAGFELGLQMMTGLYKDTPELDLQTAERLAALSPATVRVYPTIVIRGTYLAELYLEGKYRPQSLTQAVELCARLLNFFDGKSIRVIRLGLHASRELERDMLAGPYHPAFRELCESRIFLDRLTESLAGEPAGSYTVRVNPRDLSRAAGNGKNNCKRLSSLGYECRFTAADEINQNDFLIRKQDV